MVAMRAEESVLKEMDVRARGTKASGLAAGKSEGGVVWLSGRERMEEEESLRPSWKETWKQMMPERVPVLETQTIAISFTPLHN